MKFGYACINTTIPTSFRTCRLKTVEKDGIKVVKDLTIHNLNEVIKALKWNINNNVLLYRITSELIPFASHKITKTWLWWEDQDVLKLTNEINRLKIDYDLRLSTHPGQYSILNSPRETVLYNTIKDFDYHARIMDLMGATDMITHVGGAYGDKEASIQRFCDQYNNLPTFIKKKIRLENDDKVFNVQDIINIYRKVDVPLCLDIHHHNCNPAPEPIKDYIKEIFDSWKGKVPKVHISSGKTGKTDRSHHDYIHEDDFLYLLSLIEDYEVDIMFEAKCKEKSVLRILNNSFY